MDEISGKLSTWKFTVWLEDEEEGEEGDDEEEGDELEVEEDDDTRLSLYELGLESIIVSEVFKGYSMKEASTELAVIKVTAVTRRVSTLAQWKLGLKKLGNWSILALLVRLLQVHWRGNNVHVMTYVVRVAG